MTTENNPIQLRIDAQLVALTELKPGDHFQYNGADPGDWYEVTTVENERVHYKYGIGIASNWQNPSIYVWRKGANQTANECNSEGAKL